MQAVVIGNPENRRVRDFCSTASSLGAVPPKVLSWQNVVFSTSADDLSCLLDQDLVRIESPGENELVQNRLIELGGGHARPRFGEISGIQHGYAGFLQVLQRLTELEVSWQNDPLEIALMFDKWESHLLFEAASIPRPECHFAPTNVYDFIGWIRTEFGDRGRLFIKPRFASSASGVCAFRWDGDRQQLIAPIEIERTENTTRLFNSLKVRKYISTAEIQSILELLLPQEMIVERWIEKPRLPDGQFDLRVVVIAGESRHVVVRQSHFPMTNLHLGNRRGDLDEVRQLCGQRALDESYNLAERAMACFPNSLYAGVDILLSKSGKPFIGEINAFGDLLPNVLHRNETTYEAILKASRVLSHSI